MIGPSVEAHLIVDKLGEGGTGEVYRAKDSLRVASPTGFEPVF